MPLPGTMLRNARSFVEYIGLFDDFIEVGKLLQEKALEKKGAPESLRKVLDSSLDGEGISYTHSCWQALHKATEISETAEEAKQVCERAILMEFEAPYNLAKYLAKESDPKIEIPPYPPKTETKK